MVSDKYIKMCREAKELQEAWRPEEGDRFGYFSSRYDTDFGRWITSRSEKMFIRYISQSPSPETNRHGYEQWYIPSDRVFKIGVESVFSEDPRAKEYDAFWLPYQEQLQELLEKEEHFFSKVELGWKDGDCEGWDVFWLDSYMEEIYHKFWDGDEWVEKGEW